MEKSSDPESTPALNRRSFLRTFPGAGAAVASATGIGSIALTPSASAVEIGPRSPAKRRNQAFYVRFNAADAQWSVPQASHPTNADDSSLPNFIGSFTKSLPHNALGEVTPAAYNAYRRALASGTQALFNAIPLGGTAKLANPQGAYAFQLEGADSHHLTMPPAPSLSSAWCAGEMTEVYWRALTRDVSFTDYSSDTEIASAATELSSLPDFRGPRSRGGVTPGTLFRGSTPGDLTGPFISQFLYKDIPFGATTIPQRYRTTAVNDNHMTTFPGWLNNQNGGAPTTTATSDGPFYLASGRDLAEYVHYDFSYQAFQSAALILLSLGGGAIDDNSPYKTITNQGAFVTFGGPFVLDLVARVGIEALKAAWFQKWLVHRRLRPEAYAGLVHNHVTSAANYPLHRSVLNSRALQRVQSIYGTSLLPMAYPEGAPTHPAYPAGHATIAGACVTVLKAIFKESFVINSPVQANATGASLIPYVGDPLTVGGELNKLASNISLGRDTAGVHWRSDGFDGMNLGEEVAIRLLRDHKGLNNETFPGFSLTRFNGSTITI